jgi:tRNA nucleotidyltransferase (CCA-adding enzyme)
MVVVVRDDARVSRDRHDGGGTSLQAVRALPAAAPLLRRLDLAATAPLYLVGGAVRDLLLGRSPTELDLLTEGDPELLARALGAIARTHERFGTGTVELDGYRYDIVRARTETYPQPGALPVVAPATIEQDLPRRDFSVNALALALTGPRAGELITVPSARADLAAGLLRVLHDASFRDDPTRLLRMARYSARLGLSPEPHTAELARDALAHGALETVSGTRIGNELRLLAREADPVAAFTRLGELGLDAAICPDFGVRDGPTAEQALGLLGAAGRPDLLVLGLAAARIAPAPLRALLDELGFPAEDRAAIGEVACAAELAERLRHAGTPSEIAAAVGGARTESVAAAGALGAEPMARAWLEQLRHTRLQITGDDLLAAGVPAGPAVGAGLRGALAATLDGHAPTRAEQLTAALRAARAGG